MRVISSKIKELPSGRMLVSLDLADADDLETAYESISLTVEVETDDTPYLKEVQRAALTHARDKLERQIAAMKTPPRPAPPLRSPRDDMVA
jgi:hypothetical protein